MLLLLEINQIYEAIHLILRKLGSVSNVLHLTDWLLFPMEACLVRAGAQIYLRMLVGDGLVWLTLRVVYKTAVGEN